MCVRKQKRESERVEGESKGTREREEQEGRQSERGLGEISSLADERE